VAGAGRAVRHESNRPPVELAVLEPRDSGRQAATPPSCGRLVLSALVLAAERIAASGPGRRPRGPFVSGSPSTPSAARAVRLEPPVNLRMERSLRRTPRARSARVLFLRGSARRARQVIATSSRWRLRPWRRGYYRYAGCSLSGSAATASRHRSATSRSIVGTVAPIPAQCGSTSAATHHVWSDGHTNAGVPPRENSGRPQIPASAGVPQISASESAP
jgi:hypothetical protein